MTCVECRKIRADQMKELYCENKENCREAYQDGYNKALEDFINEIEKQTTFYCGKDSHIRSIAEQLKEQNKND